MYCIQSTITKKYVTAPAHRAACGFWTTEKDKAQTHKTRVKAREWAGKHCTRPNKTEAVAK